MQNQLDLSAADLATIAVAARKEAEEVRSYSSVRCPEVSPLHIDTFCKASEHKAALLALLASDLSLVQLLASALATHCDAKELSQRLRRYADDCSEQQRVEREQLAYSAQRGVSH